MEKDLAYLYPLPKIGCVLEVKVLGFEEAEVELDSSKIDKDNSTCAAEGDPYALETLKLQHKKVHQNPVSHQRKVPLFEHTEVL